MAINLDDVYLGFHPLRAIRKMGWLKDRYGPRLRWSVLISLCESKSAADIQDFHTQCTIKGGFTQAQAWWQTETRHRTR